MPLAFTIQPPFVVWCSAFLSGHHHQDLCAILLFFSQKLLLIVQDKEEIASRSDQALKDMGTFFKADLEDICKLILQFSV